MLKGAASRSDYAERLARIEKFMAAAGFEALIVAGRGVISHYGHLWFVAGYCPVVRWAVAVVRPGEATRLIVPTASDQALALVSGTPCNISIATPSTDDESGFASAIDAALERLPAGARVGVVGLEEIIPAQEYKQWSGRLVRFLLEPATEGFATAKACKTPGDLAGMRQAAAIADEGMIALIDQLRESRQPLVAAGAAEARVRSLGAHEVLVYVSSGPHFLHRPLPGKVKNGDLITAFVEISTDDGYWVELARLIVVGSLDSENSRILAAAQGALSVAAESLLPGVSAGDSHARIKAYLDWRHAKSGLWYGHGVGIDHDIPVIGPNIDTILETNMTLAVHPHIVSENGERGASLCETFVIGEDANGPALPLSRIPRSPFSI